MPLIHRCPLAGLVRRALGAAVLSTVVAGAAAADRPFAWPPGIRAAVSLAYDDALDSQLDNAIPMLDICR
jgi:hypothetical protein